MITLLVGILSLVGGILLEAWRRSIADRRWLLDRRHEAYVEFLARDEEVRRAFSEAETAIMRGEKADSFPALEAVGRLARARHMVLILGTDTAQWIAGNVEETAIKMVQALGQPVANQEAKQLARWERDLAEHLRSEVQPQRRSWRRLRRRTSRTSSAPTPIDAPRPAS